MHDINTLNRLNREAHGKAITQWRAAGRWVVAVYEGATLTAATPHDAERDAILVADRLKEVNTGRRVDLLPPTAEFTAATRDQSEDRPTRYTLAELASFGASSPAKSALA